MPQAIGPKDKLFSDLGISFTPHPVTGNLPVYKNSEAVSRALKNLILTNHNERPYEPLFGANLTARMFENFSFLTARNIELDIRRAIKNFEPRVKVQEVKVVADEDRNGVNVTLQYTFLSSEQTDTIQVFVERVR